VLWVYLDRASSLLVFVRLEPLSSILEVIIDLKLPEHLVCIVARDQWLPVFLQNK
jgi:hypothetical protein